jgi:predicted phosphodiesterase
MENLLRQDNLHLVKWVKQLMTSHNDPQKIFSCYHGSPVNPLEGYVYPDSSLNSIGSMTEKFIFLGHTHYKMNRNWAGVRFVNPGSLGQPRGGGWPTYAVVETDSCEVVFHDVIFNKSALRARIIEMGDESMYLNTVLVR